MNTVGALLEAWREAERRRDALAPGSPERLEAEEEARHAEKAYHAEVAQTSARYAEEDFQGRDPGWFPEADRRTSEAGR
ncbi:MAG TPA: hypothetical protein VF763_06505 [Candidatus Limnocylindrales bacterium]